MTIENDIPLLDEILSKFSGSLGGELAAYRNHVYRMVNFCFAQTELSDDEKQMIVIAGCFHDLGIWTAGTFDYIPPSKALAIEYLNQSGDSSLAPQIERMIGEHHKLRHFEGDRLTEIFRRGDLADFSLGIVTNGIPRSYISEVKARFPNAGFHKYLVRLAAGWICRHPLRPVPVLKW
ncbi:MAG: hypothetical protein IPL32_05960 [Chloracidobacterium sp.]|nr:hypothetical protein [Chloracidobacterium sp.]